MRTLLYVLPALLAGSLLAQNGRQVFQFTASGNYGLGGFAGRLAVLGDLNGDGFDDVAVCDPAWQVLQGGNGRVELISGADGSSIGTFTHTGPIGDLVAALGDVDGDGVPDLATANSALSGGYSGGGADEVVVISGASNALLQQVAVSTRAIAGVGDWTGDQRPDLAIENSGSVEIYDVWNGAVFATIGSATGGLTLAPVANGTAAARRLVFAAAGTVQAYDPNSSLVWSRTGFVRVDAAGDIDGDQIGDVIAQPAQGSVAEVLSGLDGTTILTVPSGDVGTGGVDLDGDGNPDVAVGDWPNSTVSAYSGQTGNLLFAYTGWEPDDGMGTALAMLPGAGAAMRPVVVAGAPQRFNGSQQAGSVHAFALAASGEVDGRIEVAGPTCTPFAARMRPFGTPPKPGSLASLRFDVITGPSPSPYLLHVFGLSDTAYQGMPLPIALPSSLGCASLRAAPEVVVIDVGGFLSFAIPANPTVVGVDVFVQALSVDLFGPISFTSSELGKIAIGN